MSFGRHAAWKSRGHRIAVIALIAAAALAAPPAYALFATTIIHKALFHVDENAGVSTAVVTGDAAMTSTTACRGNHTNPPTCNNGTASTEPAWSTDARYGSALSFDGNDQVTQPHVAALNWASTGNADNVVLEAWIKPTVAAAGTIIAKGTSAAHNYQLGITATGAVTFSYQKSNGGGGVVTLTSTLTPIRFGEWNWVSVHMQRSIVTNGVKMRVNGGNIYTADTACGGGTCAPVANTSPITIGSFGGANFFQGLIDEARVSITTTQSPPQPGSDRGVVINKVMYAPVTGPDYIDLYRPNLLGATGDVCMAGMGMLAIDPTEALYVVPGTGDNCAAAAASCESGTGSCYLLSPGERVRIWLNGAGPATDTVGTVLSFGDGSYFAAGITQWFSSNDTVNALGDGANTFGTSGHVRIRATGYPNGGTLTFLNADGMAWGAASTNLGGIVLEGFWPSNSTFVDTASIPSGIELTAAGNNLLGTASWSSSGPTASAPWLLARRTEDETRVLVEWHTPEEANLLGFHVRRALSEAPDASARVTGLLPLAPGAEATGADYQFYDDPVDPDTAYWYWIESVLVDGSSLVTGPVSVPSVSDPGRDPPACSCRLAPGGAGFPPGILAGLAACVWVARRRRREV